jgi:uncharacterized protein (DUF1800 family)
VKSLFSWDLQKDKDNDGLPDWWEVKYWGQSDLATYAETSGNLEKVSVKSVATLDIVLARASQDDVKEGKLTYEHYFDGSSPVAGATALGYTLGAPNISTVTTEYDAHRLLIQATFGPMANDADNLKALKGTAKEWILRQIALGANNINLANVDPNNVVSTIESALNNSNLSWKNNPDMKSKETSWLIDNRYFPHSSRQVDRPSTDEFHPRHNGNTFSLISPANSVEDKESHLDVDGIFEDEAHKKLSKVYKSCSDNPDPKRTEADEGDFDYYLQSAYGNLVAYRMSAPAKWHTVNSGGKVMGGNNIIRNLGADILNHQFFTKAFENEDQLRQRLAFALSQILVVSVKDNNLMGNNAMSGIANYYNVLLENSFGNYKKMLHRVTLHPVMGIYLTLRSSSKAPKPNENYARELLQLFTLGTDSLRMDGSIEYEANSQPKPSYTRPDIVNLARALTGWSFNRYREYHGRLDSSVDNDYEPLWQGFGAFDHSVDAVQFKSMWRDGVQFGPGLADPILQPTGGMIAFLQYHDTQNKVLFSNRPYQKDITGGTSAEQMNGEILSALDGIVNHPSHAPFMAKQLIGFFVTSNPSRGYIYRVAKVFRNSMDSENQLSNTIVAILTDVEARNPDVANMRTYGKIREPLIKLIHFMKLCQTRQDPVNRLLYRSLVVDGPESPAKQTNAQGLTQSQKKNTDYIFKNSERYGDFYRRLFRPNSLLENIGQQPLSAPSVFNFYSPQFTTDYLNYYRMRSPASQILTPAMINSNLNYVVNGIYNAFGYWGNTTISLSRGAENATEYDIKMNALEAYPNTEQNIKRYISKAAFGGRLPQSYLSALNESSAPYGIFDWPDKDDIKNPNNGDWETPSLSIPSFESLGESYLPTNHKTNLTYGYERKYNQLRSATLLYVHPSFSVQK